MFEKASRLKLRFDTTRGPISAEDLWDLSLTSTTGKVNLDDIAKGIHKQLKETTDVVSFVDDTKKTDDVLQLKMDIVKRVIEVKKAENAATAELRAKSEKKQQLLGLIAQKENEQLAGQSIEDLRALVNTL